jgi:hypothetical protein
VLCQHLRNWSCDGKKVVLPIPTGAMNVALCFSFANMRIVKTSSAVKKASIKRPLGMLSPSLNVVLTFAGAGNNPMISPEAAMLPTICAKNKNSALTNVIAPVNNSANVTYPLTC